MATKELNQRLQLMPSKANPSVRRWQRRWVPSSIAPKKEVSPVRAGLITASVPLIALGATLAHRGRSLRALERLVPKVSTKNPEQFYSLLQEGDLIFVESTKKALSSVSGRMMQKAVGSMPHVAVYTGNKKIVHVTPQSKKMIGDSPGRWIARNQNMIVIRPEGDRGAEIARAAKESIGKYEYTKKVLPRVTAATFLPKSMAERITRIKEGKVICTTATAEILDKAGVKLPKSPGQMVSIDYRSLSNPPVLKFSGSEGIVKTSPYQGAGFLIPGFTLAAGSALVKEAGVFNSFYDELNKIAFLR